MPPPRVAVIGAGPCGLVALKTLKEDGFDVILYERRDYVGGLWKYSTDDSISVADNTEFNSSKFRSALSDFPMPDDMADFPTAKQLYKYFCDYCTHFGLWEHIKLGHEVKKMQFLRATDSKTSGQCLVSPSFVFLELVWANIDASDGKDLNLIPVRAKQWVLSISTGGLDYKVSFEKVAVATGPWTRPRPLKFPGLDQFKGRIVHSMHFHDPASYTGNVLVVGMSASAQDIVSALPGHASKVYLSHKSGVVLIPRYTRDGSTWDHGPTLNQTVWLAWLFTWLPKRYYEYLDGRLQRLSKWAYPNIPPSWNLSPPPSSAVAPPLVAAQLWPHLESGFCELVPEVAGVCGDTVKLSSGGMHGTYRGILHNTIRKKPSIYPNSKKKKKKKDMLTNHTPPTFFRNATRNRPHHQLHRLRPRRPHHLRPRRRPSLPSHPRQLQTQILPQHHPHAPRPGTPHLPRPARARHNFPLRFRPLGNFQLGHFPTLARKFCDAEFTRNGRVACATGGVERWGDEGIWKEIDVF